MGLLIEPFSVEEVEKEIRLFAQDEWARRRVDIARRGEDETDDPSQEVHRVIRGLAGYAEYQEVYQERGMKRRRNVRPLDKVVPMFASAEELAGHLIQRANLPARDATEWWRDDADPESLSATKKIFEDEGRSRVSHRDRRRQEAVTC